MKQEKIDMLNKLPEKVQEEVREMLKAWQGCYVDRHEETGEYHVTTGCALTAGHNPWRGVCKFDNTDIYTREEINRYAQEVWGGCDMSAW